MDRISWGVQIPRRQFPNGACRDLLDEDSGIPAELDPSGTPRCKPSPHSNASLAVTSNAFLQACSVSYRHISGASSKQRAIFPSAEKLRRSSPRPIPKQTDWSATKSYAFQSLGHRHLSMGTGPSVPEKIPGKAIGTRRKQDRPP